MNGRVRKWLYGLVLPLLVGMLLSLAYPPVEANWLVWCVPVLLLFILWRGAPATKTGRWGFRTGLLSGLGFFLLNLKWLWTVTGFGAVFLGSYLAIYWAIWGFYVAKYANPFSPRLAKEPKEGDRIAQKIAEKLSKQEKGSTAWSEARRSLWYALLVASAWVGQEWLRGWLFTGFGWNGLGIGVAASPVLAQAADLVGTTGLSFLPVFFAGVLIQVVRRMSREVRLGRMKAHLDFCFIVLLMALVFSYGIQRINQISKLQGQEVGIVLVQQNIEQSIKWEEDRSAEIYQGYVSQTEQALSQIVDKSFQKAERESNSNEGGDVELTLPSIDFVIWPESAVSEPIFHTPQGEFLMAMKNRVLLERQIFPLGDFEFIVGLNDHERDLSIEPKEEARYNAMALFGDELKPKGLYRKNHLVLYGEYIPLIESVPFFKNVFEWVTQQKYGGNFTASDRKEPLALERNGKKLSLIPAICFEDTVGRLTRQFVRHEPQIIVNVTNDGWFFQSEAAQQHLANARMRSIELRRPMARCANTGVSVLFDELGQPVKDLDGNPAIIREGEGPKSHFVEGWTYGRLRIADEPVMTLYALAGDWFSYLMLAVSLLGLRRMRA